MTPDDVDVALLYDGFTFNCLSWLEGLGFCVDPPPETNMVMFQVEDTPGFVRETRARKLLINPMAEGLFRAVTHLDVGTPDIDEAVGRIEEITRGGIR